MGGKPASTGRKRGRSGCRTCRIRRIKCDEAWPACSRCASTGRTCDGYGIWGGGGGGVRGAGSAYYGSRPPRPSSVQPTNPNLPPAKQLCWSSPVSPDEHRHLEWFFAFTVVKLPGIFSTPFWEAILPQASVSEPSVRHAIVALSSAHKREGAAGSRYTEGSKLDSQEVFTLNQYTRAIQLLVRPRDSPPDGSVLRVALLACAVFIHVELLRGHYQTARLHLQSGLNLLRQIPLVPSATGPATYSRSPISASTEDSCIIQIFARLHMQARLFDQTMQSPALLPTSHDLPPPAPCFRSTSEARIRLDVLLDEVIQLRDDCQRLKTAQDAEATPTSHHLKRQHRLQTEIATCLYMLEASTRSALSNLAMQEVFSYHILRGLYLEAELLAHVAVYPRREARYDLYRDSFLALLRHCIATRQTYLASGSNPLNHQKGQHSESIADLGWVPPLYFVALKCRVPRIRRQAIRLLESIPHKEGFWDAGIAAAVAEKVAELEQGEFYDSWYVDHDFPLDSEPTDAELSLPLLPEWRRMSEVKVMLPEGSIKRMAIVCKRTLQNGTDEITTLEYDTASQIWVHMNEHSRIK